METWSVINKLSSQTDLLGFLTPLWSSLFSILYTGMNLIQLKEIVIDTTKSDERQLVLNALQKTSQANMLSGRQAHTFLSQVCSCFVQLTSIT